MAEIVVLTNPQAGKGRGSAAARVALPRLRRAGYTVTEIVGRDADEARCLLAEAVAAGVETVVTCGGDGTVHLAIQELAGRGTRLGVIPGGTGNDVARYLNVPRNDPAAAADIVIAGRERLIDLAQIGPRYFITVLAAGFDAIVNERANQMTWPRGQMRYNIATLLELRRFSPLTYTIEADGVTDRFEAMLVAVGNGPSFGGGLRITEGARLDDGLLDVAIVGPMSRFDMLRTFPRLFNGTVIHHPKYRRLRASTVTVAAPGVVAYADGERVAPLPLTVTAAPASLRVVTG